MSETPTQREWWALQEDVKALKSDTTELKTESKQAARNLERIKSVLEGDPPHSLGMRGELNVLRKDHDDLEGLVGNHISAQDKGQAKREGIFSGARLVYAILAAMLAIVSAILVIILNSERVFTGGG